ncbi:lysylphosphatidylglycerol synthase transmembrane domain-containing protein [Dethiobacter alkaliphilus]|uniref:lysylphosphatidylglycerol synthase transmembrane domain-containing protein n=1 Tax=Dethiobacter alkaliphilus TaxID=427926 RepID=UPI002227F137|nr:lysylphosphatidylglycerol synthase transmembrane domain-containing protein [Dethiobacter alkaliphilus]MCW3489436.1 flippase-like domain-containing protein [Dethiobacter alkaliphilus]
MKRIWLPVAAVLAVICLLWVADIGQIAMHLSMVKSSTVIYACLLQLLTIILINVQWKKAGEAIGQNIPLQKILYVNMAGTFVESVTPAVKTGGEVTKAYLFRSQMGLTSGQAVAMVSLQKAASVFTFVLINIIGMVWYLTLYGIRGPQGTVLLISLAFLLVVLVVVLGLVFAPQRLIAMLCCLPLVNKARQKLSTFAESLHHCLQQALVQRRKMLGVIFLSVLVWAIFACKAYLISHAMHLQASFLQIAVITYFAYMVAMVPLLPGGLGSFEGSMLFLLTPIGVPLAQGLTMALVLRFVTFWFVFILSAAYLGIDTLSQRLVPHHR